MSPTADAAHDTKSINVSHRRLIGENKYSLPDTTTPHRNSEMLTRAPHEQLTTLGPSMLHSHHGKKTKRRSYLSRYKGVYTADGGSDSSGHDSNVIGGDSNSESQNTEEEDVDIFYKGGGLSIPRSDCFQSTRFENEKRSVNYSRHFGVRDQQTPYLHNFSNNSFLSSQVGDGSTDSVNDTSFRNAEGTDKVKDLKPFTSSSSLPTGLSDKSSLSKNEVFTAIQSSKAESTSNNQYGLRYPNISSDTSVKTPSAMTATPKSSLSTGINGPASSSRIVSPEEPRGSPQRPKETEDPNHVSHQFFHLEPCLYIHRMFERAARIFAVLKHDDADTEALRRRNGDAVTVKEKIPEMDFTDAQEQIKTFELTFATLKFQKLFSSILDYIGFFYKYSELNDHYSLIYVILHDLQTRKFQRRIPFPDEILDPVCIQVEEALLIEKTKLQANIAKERIKHNAPTVDFLLPEHVRNKDETKAKTPVYMWVNQMKATVDNVISNLKADDFRLLDAGTDMSDIVDQAFLIDPHCPDVLTFPPHLNMELKALDMVKAGLLVQQDKSSCLAPQTVSYLLGHDQDVIHVNIGTAMTTCHLASLLRHKSPHSHIWAFGVDSPQKTAKVMKTMESLDVKNVKIVHEEFLNVDPEDQRFKSVRVILISANCSKSAITSPVQFIVSEGEDTQILGELSMGEANMSHVRDLMVDHERLLKHALRFPKLQAVVYTTRSRFEAENEQMVLKVLEFLSMTTNGKRSPFKVAPPVIPFTADEIDSGKGGVEGRFVRFLPTDKANGCFVAIIAREPEESKDMGRPGGGKSKSKGGVSKSSSAQNPGGGRRRKKSVKAGISLPEVPGASPNGENTETSTVRASSAGSAGASLKQKISQHKSPAAIGARLYQKKLIDKMEKSRDKMVKPEHMKVVKHPSPFR